MPSLDRITRTATFLSFLLGSNKYLPIATVLADSLQPRCGDCWCIVDQSEDGTEVGQCPTDQEGILDTFPSNIYQVYETFQLTNPDATYLTLQSEDGGYCYPFADTLEPIEGYPGSFLPQCVLPVTINSTETAEGSTAVCAFLYEPETECQNRKYQILNYDSAESAEKAGAIVTHSGHCGVCSDANSLWARMASIDDFEAETLICGVSYILNQNKETRFDDLIQCAVDVGLGQQCALLWAHLGATLLNECSSVCTTGTSSETSGPPPQCILAECPACPAAWNANFAILSGRTLVASGISERTAQSCSQFYRINHDPCIGATTTTMGSTSPPKTSPTSSGFSRNYSMGPLNDYLFGVILVLSWISIVLAM